MDLRDGGFRSAPEDFHDFELQVSEAMNFSFTHEIVR